MRRMPWAALAFILLAGCVDPAATPDADPQGSDAPSLPTGGFGPTTGPATTGNTTPPDTRFNQTYHLSFSGRAVPLGGSSGPDTNCLRLGRAPFYNGTITAVWRADSAEPFASRLALVVEGTTDDTPVKIYDSGSRTSPIEYSFERLPDKAQTGYSIFVELQDYGAVMSQPFDLTLDFGNTTAPIHPDTTVCG